MDRVKSAGRWLGRSRGPGWPIIAATLVLLLVSPLLVPGSLGRGPLATMLPFAAILAITALGQTLVIQQGGVDFSVPGTVSLSAVTLTKFADQDSDRMLMALLVVVGVAVLIGVVNALFVAVVGVTPIVATLGVNALVLGAMRRYSGGLSVPPAPDPVKAFALGRTFGVHNTLLVAIVVTAVVWFVVKRTVPGRRFEAAGANVATARAGGIAVNGYRAGAYVAASILYAIAGVLLAGFLNAPRIDAGEPYLLGSIAATVIGGTSLAGGAGSLIGALFGAVFLTQLGQLLLGLGYNTSVNLIVQGAVIAVAMAIHTLARNWRARVMRMRALASEPVHGGRFGRPVIRGGEA